MTEVKDDLVRNNNTVNWIPESIGSIDYMEFHSDFSEETGRFDTKVLKKLADQMVQALSVQE